MYHRQQKATTLAGTLPNSRQTIPLMKKYTWIRALWIMNQLIHCRELVVIVCPSWSREGTKPWTRLCCKVEVNLNRLKCVNMVMHQNPQLKLQIILNIPKPKAINTSQILGSQPSNPKPHTLNPKSPKCVTLSYRVTCAGSFTRTLSI